MAMAILRIGLSVCCPLNLLPRSEMSLDRSLGRRLLILLEKRVVYFFFSFPLEVLMGFTEVYTLGFSILFSLD